MNKKEQTKKISALLAGLAVYQLGASILLLSGFGADPYNVLIQGIHTSVSLDHLSFFTHGFVHILVSLLLAFLLFLISHSLVKLGTLLCALLGGPLIDLFTRVLTPVYEQYANSSYFYLMFAAGFGMLAYGMALMLRSDAGYVPNELITEIFPKLKKNNPYYAALAAYILFGLVGFLLGGLIGFGTLLCMAAAIPLADYFSQSFSKKADPVLKK